MPFQPIVAPNLSAAAASQIRELIAQDVLRPGDQLPGERELAQRMGVSRTCLRGALQTLVTEGLLISRHGAGLKVAEDLGKSISDPMITLLESTPDAVNDYLRFRAMIEGECAATVAAEATDSEIDAILDILTRMQRAHDAEDEEAESRLDTEFHMAIVEASRNVVTIQVARSLHQLLLRFIARSRAVIYGDDKARAQFHSDHRAIGTAIKARDAQAARAAMHRHLRTVEETLARKSDEIARSEMVEKRRAWVAEAGS